MQCQNKNASEESAIKWSQQTESVLKDAQCTFGILKNFGNDGGFS